MFIKHQDMELTVLIVYVDDITITGDDVEEISKVEYEVNKSI